MGSVMQDIPCPKCSYKYCMLDYYYKQGYEIIYCEKCGYYYDGSKRSRKASGGFGAHKIMFNSGGGSGSFKKENDYKKFYKHIKKNFKKMVNGNNESPKEIYYTFKKEEKWFIHYLCIDGQEVDKIIPYNTKQLLEEL